MTLSKVNGDLVEMAYEGQFEYVVHGCNCFHTMASGIAGAVAKRFPKVILADFTSAYGSRDKLGKWTEATVIDKNFRELTIINAYTQFTYSRNKDVFEYGAFETFLETFEQSLRERAGKPEPGQSPLRIGFPKIGCGLAGGDESRILPMLEAFSNRVSDFARVSLVALP